MDRSPKPQRFVSPVELFDGRRCQLELDVIRELDALRKPAQPMP